VSKNTRGVKEFTREQRLSKENRQLKRELTHLRKQIARLDTDRFETMKRISDQEESEMFQENLGTPNSNIEDLKKEWSCNSCNIGYLEITLYPRAGETFYFRACSSCKKRTKGQRYGTEVKGIIKK